MEKILYNAMFTKIQKNILENKNELENLKKIDNKYCKINFEINKLIEIIEKYKEKNIENKNNEKIIYCNGNPYIVLNLFMIAIINNINIKINIDNNMVGINKLILKIINNILKENKLKIQIEIIEKINCEKEIIFIDRINDFNILRKKQKNIRFIPYQMIDIFYDDEFDELFEKIYEYAINQNIDIDIFDEEEGIESLIKYGKSNKKIILTKNKKILDKYKNEKIYLNKNPFKYEEIIFSDNMIKSIIK